MLMANQIAGANQGTGGSGDGNQPGQGSGLQESDNTLIVNNNTGDSTGGPFG